MLLCEALYRTKRVDLYCMKSYDSVLRTARRGGTRALVLAHRTWFWTAKVVLNTWSLLNTGVWTARHDGLRALLHWTESTGALFCTAQRVLRLPFVRPGTTVYVNLSDSKKPFSTADADAKGPAPLEVTVSESCVVSSPLSPYALSAYALSTYTTPARAITLGYLLRRPGTNCSAEYWRGPGTNCSTDGGYAATRCERLRT
eukprot:602978-Rhodomonas_salina.3